MNFNYDDYWNTENFIENIKINQKNVKYTINDLEYYGNKIALGSRLAPLKGSI